jgi:hypothetical protein
VGSNRVRIDSVGAVAVITPQNHGSEDHQWPVCNLSALVFHRDKRLYMGRTADSQRAPERVCASGVPGTTRTNRAKIALTPVGNEADRTRSV